jgi:methionyl-tRNA formyltransferase
MRVIFMGTPDFSVPALKALASRHDIVAVYSQPPRQAGRGQKPRPGPVHAFAEQAGFAVHTPSSLKKPYAQEVFASHAADVAVVAAYGLILPQPVLSAPTFGCLNIHASLLPRWRGAAPIQRAIMAGDTETGVTIMQMDAGLDTGAMLLSERVVVDDTTTAGLLHDQLSDLGSRLIVEALSALEAGTLAPEPQPEHGVTYANKITKSEAHLTFAAPAPYVLRHVHGLSPYPGAFVVVGGKRLKILTAEHVPSDPDAEEAQPGTILDDSFTLACAPGTLRPRRVQLEGKAPLDAADFLRGFELPIGTTVG